MKTVTDKTEILAMLPEFCQTIFEPGRDGETIEHGHINPGDDNETTARVIYALPADGEYYDEDGAFIGDWNDHIVRMEIDSEEA